YHRLEDHGVGLAHAVLERHGGSHAERDFVRVQVRVRTLEQRDLDVHHREADQHTDGHGLLHAALYRQDTLPQHRAALDGVGELEALAGLVRFELDPDVTVLTAAARLLDELPFDGVAGLADGFAVRHLRCADVALDVELALHAVNDDLQVQLAHTGDDGLTGLLVGTHAERRVFLRQAVEGDAHLLLVALGLRLDGDVNHRIREFHALQDDRVVG